MNNGDYQYRFRTGATPAAVYEAIARVTAWWTINMDGASREVGDVFSVQFGDVHFTVQEIIEARPGARMEWRITGSRLPWLKDPAEWKGTRMVFEIATTDDGSQLTFTHIGLTPEVECFAQCEKGWGHFIGTSLFKLITEGAGLPDTTERTHLDTIGHVRPTNP